MVYLFNLWNFFKHENGTYEFDVTEGNYPSVNNGTEEWIKQCMFAFGVEVTVSSWEVIPFRTYYLSSYPGKNENWEDRWTKGWTIRVFPDGETPPVKNQLFDVPRDVDVADATWNDELEEDERHNKTALIISDHQDELTRVEQLAQEIITRTDLGSGQDVNAELAIHSFGEEIHQLRITLTGVTFPDDVATLDRLLEHCKHYNGVVNWRSRLTWREQEREKQYTLEMLAWRDKLLGKNSSDQSNA